MKSATLQKVMIDTNTEPVGDSTTEVHTTAQPVDGSIALASPVVEEPAFQPTPPAAPAPQSPEPVRQPVEVAPQPVPLADKTFFQDFKAGDTDPLVGVTIREVLIKTDGFIVYIDQDFSLHSHWNLVVDPNCFAPIFNRVGELQAKSEFLRQTSRKRDLVSARRPIGEGLVFRFWPQTQAYAKPSLATAKKSITKI